MIDLSSYILLRMFMHNRRHFTILIQCFREKNRNEQHSIYDNFMNFLEFNVFPLKFFILETNLLPIQPTHHFSGCLAGLLMFVF